VSYTHGEGVKKTEGTQTIYVPDDLSVVKILHRSVRQGAGSNPVESCVAKDGNGQSGSGIPVGCARVAAGEIARHMPAPYSARGSKSAAGNHPSAFFMALVADAGAPARLRVCTFRSTTHETSTPLPRAGWRINRRGPIRLLPQSRAAESPALVKRSAEPSSLLGAIV
jgi:hypothetical protein